MSAYYNEIDPHAAQWIRNLIAAGLIAPGDVDERSIEDVRPDELRGYTQCHFFAGIGGWAHALDLAGWPRDRPVWTGSCPCQPFSAAGKGAGFEDERHLWPAWQHLIAQCRPPVVFGEQVASKHADAWIDLVHADMEGMGYAFGCVPFPAAGIGAPHIRDRNYWLGVGLADAHDAGLEGWRLSAERSAECLAGPRGVAGGMADAHDAGLEGWRLSAERSAECLAGPRGVAGGMADAHGSGRQRRRAGKASDGRNTPRLEPQRLRDAFGVADNIMQQRPDGQPGICHEHDASGRVEGAATIAGLCGDLRPGPTNGFWRSADWIGCTDGKWRPVEPGTSPLASGLPARVVRLRGYGNAINAHAAKAFIESYLEARGLAAIEAAA